ncbi:hypothetical protein RND81_01G085900 [Saponaria officinalis]|uniref:Solute carrier family 35 member F1 n=1 Tax=Saponaria officinalis TaxID=3572 RepID=A0AAW1NHH1_SAPOF
MGRFSNNEGLWRTVFIVLLGQLISFIMSLSAFSNSFLASLGVDAPITQSFFTYLSITAVYGSIRLFLRKKLMVSWYYYVPLSFVDVLGNYCVIKAFQFTSITSATLFDCWTIPWVMVLTYFFIGSRYSIWQYFGVAICILGLALALLSDAGLGGEGGSRPLLGDFLVIVGTLFYALSNVGEEFCVKQKDLVEVISMLGVFGLLISICEITLLERHKLLSIEWSSKVMLGFAGHAVAGFLFYTLVPFLLKLSGSTLFNLSALTSDMWAVLIRILFYHEQVGWLYYVSFATVALGLVTYSLSEEESTEMSNVDGHLKDQYRVLTEESGRETASV